MRKSQLIRDLEAIPGDPEILIEDRSLDGCAREAQEVAEVYAVTDAALRSDDRIFWEKDDPDRPAQHPGDDPEDPEPMIALVLR